MKDIDLNTYIYNDLNGIIYIVFPSDVYRKIVKEQAIRHNVFSALSVFDKSHINFGKTFFFMHKEDLKLIFENIDGYRNFEFDEYIMLKIDLSKCESQINFIYNKNLYAFNCINTESSIPLECCIEKHILNNYEDIKKLSK